MELEKLFNGNALHIEPVLESKRRRRFNERRLVSMAYDLRAHVFMAGTTKGFYGAEVGFRSKDTKPTFHRCYILHHVVPQIDILHDWIHRIAG